MNLKPLKISATFLALFAFSFTGCGPGEEGNGTDDGPKDSTSVITVSVDGKIFSIPSPIQTAMLIKRSGAGYNKGFLNPADKVNGYSMQMQKALNLGVFGADLGYVTMYDQNQDAIAYFQAAQKLADDLGVSGAFDKALIERFKTNIGKQDSMLVLVSTAYRSADNFLKNNDKNAIGALIITGGWIESLHFAVNVNKDKTNEEVKQRIAEQKISIGNLIGLLETYAGQEEYSEILNGLRELKSDFDKVEYKYVYEKPVTDEGNKLTTFNSKTTVNITPEQLASITAKVESLRALIVE
ncbi:MAG: hypothetical protein IT233_07020 [Bacteroidia bacterium]|nr:hypothetical protein [Bacteroidia bacterium]